MNFTKTGNTSSSNNLPFLSTASSTALLPNVHSSRRIVFLDSNSSNKKNKNSSNNNSTTNAAATESQGQQQQQNYPLLEPGATLLEKILSAKVSELQKANEKLQREKEGLAQSLRNAVHSHTALESRLQSVTELLAASASASASKKTNANKHLFNCCDVATQAPELVNADELNRELAEKQSLYNSTDIRAALLSLLDRHEDVKHVLLRNSWLQRNQDFTEKFPSFTRPASAMRVELDITGRKPPSAEDLIHSENTPRSILKSELSEMTRRSHPQQRHRHNATPSSATSSSRPGTREGVKRM